MASSELESLHNHFGTYLFWNTSEHTTAGTYKPISTIEPWRWAAQYLSIQVLLEYCCTWMAVTLFCRLLPALHISPLHKPLCKIEALSIGTLHQRIRAWPSRPQMPTVELLIIFSKFSFCYYPCKDSQRICPFSEPIMISLLTCLFLHIIFKIDNTSLCWNCS